MVYITKLVDVPTLPPVSYLPAYYWTVATFVFFQDPPSFLRGSFLADLELSQQVVTHSQPEEASLRTDTLLDLASSPAVSAERVTGSYAALYTLHF